MKITELKDWSTLTEKEQARLREVYQVSEYDELPASFTKDMAGGEQTPPVAPENTIVTPTGETNVTINAENVEVHEAQK